MKLKIESFKSCAIVKGALQIKLIALNEHIIKCLASENIALSFCHRKIEKYQIKIK